jgi:hypothetical protein
MATISATIREHGNFQSLEEVAAALSNHWKMARQNPCGEMDDDRHDVTNTLRKWNDQQMNGMPLRYFILAGLMMTATVSRAGNDAMESWRALKYGMFIHFGMSTFTGR